METFSSSGEEKRALECINRGNFWVCTDCANKYSKNPPYGSVLTMHNNTCYICEQHKMVGPSYKLFGYYQSDIR